jgi:hypothetical protein
MAEVEVRIQVRVKSEDTKDRLDGMRDRAHNMRPVLHWAGGHLERALGENFTTMGAMSARAMLKGGWAPLTPKYGAWKMAHFPGEPTLIQTGGLFAAVTNMDDDISDMRGTYSVNSRIGKFHQYGTKDMVARPIVFVPRDFDRELGKKATTYIMEGSKIT